ncbi:MAG: 2-C-methyl-D-erythritol 4-phosphate cytidylyltransferase [Opitutales bacterium]
MPTEINCALLLAAGSGARMQGCVEDKILAPIQGRPAFSYSLRVFAACPSITTICIVFRDEAQKKLLQATLDQSIRQQVIWVQGGKERQESVLNGLLALPADAQHTLIHDCARPLLPKGTIQVLIDTAREDGAACLAHPVADTIKRIPAPGVIKQTPLEDLERNRLWAMETPQAFRHPDILEAYRKITSEGLQVTDDCAAAAHLGITTTLIPNLAPNPKITTAADLKYIEWLQQTTANP